MSQKASRLWWNGAQGDASATPAEGEEFISTEYLNPSAGSWIMVIKDGKEIRRYNVLYIATIEWEADNDEA